MRGSLKTSRILPLLIGVIAYAHAEYIDRALFTFLEKELNDAPVDLSADGKPLTDDMPMATPPIAAVFRGRSRRSIEPIPPRDLTKSIGPKKGHQVGPPAPPDPVLYLKMMEQEEKKDTLVHHLPVMGNQIPNQPAAPAVSPSLMTTPIPSGTPVSVPLGKENPMPITPPPVLSVARNPLPSPVPQVPTVAKNPLPSRPAPPPPPSHSTVSNLIPSPPPPTTLMVSNPLPSQPAVPSGPRNPIPNGPLAMPSSTRNSIPSRPVSPPPLPPVINEPILSQDSVLPPVTRNPVPIQTAVPTQAVPFRSQVLSTILAQPIIPSRPVPLPSIPNQPPVASQPTVIAFRPELRSQFPGGATSTQVVRFPAGFNQGAVFSQLPRSQAVFPARNPIPNRIGVFRPAVWNQAPTQTVVFQRTFRPFPRVVNLGPGQRQVIMDRPEWAPQARGLVGGFRWGMVPNPTPLRVRQFSGPREWEFDWGGDSRWSAFNRDPRFFTDTRASLSQSPMPNSRMFLRNQFNPRQFVQN